MVRPGLPQLQRTILLRLVLLQTCQFQASLLNLKDCLPNELHLIKMSHNNARSLRPHRAQLCLSTTFPTLTALLISIPALMDLCPCLSLAHHLLLRRPCCLPSVLGCLLPGKQFRVSLLSINLPAVTSSSRSSRREQSAHLQGRLLYLSWLTVHPHTLAARFSRQLPVHHQMAQERQA